MNRPSFAWGARRGEAEPEDLSGLVTVPYFWFLRGFWRRTPGPPPFSSMNSTPAASNARRTANSFAVVMEVALSASSARRIVRKLTLDWRARSSAVHLIRDRAALIWALVRTPFVIDILNAICHF
jgi:hypothetical protein